LFLDANALTAPDTRWIAAYLLALAASAAAGRLGALSGTGIAAATIVGGSIVAAAGWWPGVVLVVFFTSASVLSIAFPRPGSEDRQVRGKRRDAVQVFANGGMPAALAVIAALARDDAPWLMAMLAAIAGASSDTWGTETGRLSPVAPRLVTTWRPVTPGTSGAVSAIGTLGSALGALLIGAVAAIGTLTGWSVPGIDAWALLLIVTGAGFAGSVCDSLLGATVQAGYWCPLCQQPTERLVHRCGTRTTLVRGWALLDNDVVNLLAITFAAVVAFIIAYPLN
jgi:uncharacterized protein (TIGR00297 family)